VNWHCKQTSLDSHVKSSTNRTLCYKLHRSGHEGQKWRLS